MMLHNFGGCNCCRYEVMVRDGGTPRRSATQLLVIQVLDVNDEVPRFDKSAYYFSVLENRPLGTAVGTVRATDADVSPNFSRISYAIRQVRLLSTKNCIYIFIHQMVANRIKKKKWAGQTCLRMARVPLGRITSVAYEEQVTSVVTYTCSYELND